MPTVRTVICTPDLERQRVFYERLLGAVETDRFPADGRAFSVDLRLGDSAIGLVEEAGTALSAPARMLLSVEVEDVDALLEEVEAAGGRWVGGPTDMPWGQRVAHIHDPDGNMVNLTQARHRGGDAVRG